MTYFNMDAITPKNCKKRKRYSEKFKRKAVALLIKSGKPAGEVAILLGIERSNLQKWKKQFLPLIALHPPGDETGFYGPNELRSMQEEIATLKQMVYQLQAIMRKAFVNLYQEEREPSRSE